MTMHLSQPGLAELLGSSTRTVQRWETDRATPLPTHVYALADAVRGRDPGLADELEAWAETQQPRVVLPPALVEAPRPAPAPARSNVPSLVLVDSLVCAAAEALSMAPQAVRPAIIAAFQRARFAGLSVDDVLAVLEAPEPDAHDAS